MSRRFFPSYNTSPSVTVKASRPARTPARVLLPEPLGPMMACTSPAFTLRLTPRRISLSSTRACKLKIVSMPYPLRNQFHGQYANHSVIRNDFEQDGQRRIFVSEEPPEWLAFCLRVVLQG